MTAYTTFATGPRRLADPDGPDACHVVILDNGRSELLATDMRQALSCIRCGACINHCPVYGAVGGHAYGWVYPGPIGAVLTPALIGLGESRHLPNASTFCGRCEEVCPVKIPLVRLIRGWRNADFTSGTQGLKARLSLAAFAAIARRPRLYHLVSRFAAVALATPRGRFRRLPFLGGWTHTRDFPASQGRSFQQLWSEAKRGVPK
jgi:L-lactate dehydrogenase complex protein LldF